MIPSRINSICFTGHRQLSVSEEKLLFEKLMKILTYLCERGLENCYNGGAIGFDALAASAVFKVKENHPQLRLDLILPCKGQENSWDERQKQDYHDMLNKADSIRILSPNFYNGCMQIRNREMLNLSELCIAYLRPGTSGGGSLNTVLQAVKLGIPVINIADDESEYFK